MSGQYSSRLGWDGAAVARVTGLPRALEMSSVKRGSSEVTLMPSGRVTRTGGSGFPTSGGVTNAARNSNMVGHFFGFLALTILAVSVSTKASERSPSKPRSVTSEALSSSPIIDFTGYRHKETTAPSGILPSSARCTGMCAPIVHPAPSRDKGCSSSPPDHCPRTGERGGVEHRPRTPQRPWSSVVPTSSVGSARPGRTGAERRDRLADPARGAIGRLMMPQDETPSLYDRLDGVYNIAVVVDDLIDRVMVDARLNANPRVDEAHSDL